MNRPGRSTLWVRLLLAIAGIAGLGILAWWEVLTVLFSAPWLAAIVWVIVRLRAQGIDLGGEDGFPSAAEIARRRLWVS